MTEVCTCEPSDPGGVDLGCPTHGVHPCRNANLPPHESDSHGRCCAHCQHPEEIDAELTTEERSELLRVSTRTTEGERVPEWERELFARQAARDAR